MSYVPGTILKRTEPADDPYDEVRVIGFSPVSASVRDSEWTDGVQQNEVVITPVSFGKNIQKPYGALQRDYEVVTIPEAPERAELTLPPPSKERPEESIKRQLQEAAKAKRGRAS